MKRQKPIAVVAGARTPFAKAFTDLQGVSAVELGRLALLDALRRCGLTGADIDEVVMGNVAGPPDAANIARVIALKPACRSIESLIRSIETVLPAWNRFWADGRRSTRSVPKIVVAGGTESMSNVPLLFNREAADIWMRLAKCKTIDAATCERSPLFDRAISSR